MNYCKKFLLCVFSLFFVFYNLSAFAEADSAKEFKGISQWVNSEPMTLESLKGKVVLIEFWSSSCPNCTRSIPSVKKLYNKYSKDGLLILSIHVPLHGQKSIDTIKQAIDQYGIKYPVAVDNNLSSARLYGVHQLPAFYLINRDGKIIYQVVGAGNEDSLEKNIKKAMES